LFHQTNIRIGILPSVYEGQGAELGLDFGTAGTIWFQYRMAGSDMLFPTPPLEGELADATVLLVGRAEQDVDEEDADDPVLTMPQGRKFRRDIEDPADYTGEEPYMISVLPSPPAQLNWDGSMYSCLPQNGTHLGAVIIEGLTDRAPHWRATVFGPLQPFHEPPVFPSSWGWAGVPEDELLVRAWAAKLGVDPNELRYADFPGLVTDTAHAAASVGVE